MVGYNIALKLNTKTILGRTQDDLTIAARTKESLTKDDQGNAKKVVTGHDVSFKVSSLLEVGATGNTQLDRDEVIALALQTGTEAVIPLRYECEGGDTYGGNAIITGYSESSSANPDEDATISLDLEISGAFAKIPG